MKYYMRNIVAVTLVLFLALSQGNIAYAVLGPWNQTDWSGGVGTSTATEYSTAINSNTASTAGQITLPSNGEEFSNTGFESDLSGWTALGFVNGKSIDLVSASSQSISVADSDSLSFGNGATNSPFSISVWVYEDTISGNVNFVQKRYNPNFEWALYRVASNYYFRVYNGGTYTNYLEARTNALPNAGNWVHVTATYDGGMDASGVNLYIDGTLDTDNRLEQNTFTASSNTTSITEIGKNLTGKLDQVVVWGKELTSGEVSSLVETRDLTEHSAYGDIVSWWDFEDADISGATLSDRVGSNDGTILNSPSQSASIPPQSTQTFEPTTTYDSSAGSVEVSAVYSPYNFTQSLNTGDTYQYNLYAYAYTDGSAVTATDVEFVIGGTTATTTYTGVGGGWYQMYTTTTGAATTVAYGAQVKTNKTVYLDDFSLSRYSENEAVLTSNIFDTEQSSDWGNITYTVSGTGNSTVVARSGNLPTLSDATDFSSCTALVSGTDLTDNDCFTDSNRYVQYQVQLSATDTSTTPIFEDITVNFTETPAGISGGIVAYGCRDEKASNYNYFVRHKQSTCRYEETAPATTTPQQVEPTNSGGGGRADVSLLQNRLTKKGDRGTHVQQLQTAINGNLNTKLDQDGVFGPITEIAVMLFQYTKELDIDGIVGPQTTNALGGE